MFVGRGRAQRLSDKCYHTSVLFVAQMAILATFSLILFDFCTYELELKYY